MDEFNRGDDSFKKGWQRDLQKRGGRNILSQVGEHKKIQKLGRHIARVVMCAALCSTLAGSHSCKASDIATESALDAPSQPPRWVKWLFTAMQTPLDI